MERLIYYNYYYFIITIFIDIYFSTKIGTANNLTSDKRLLLDRLTVRKVVNTMLLQIKDTENYNKIYFLANGRQKNKNTISLSSNSFGLNPPKKIDRENQSSPTK